MLKRRYNPPQLHRIREMNDYIMDFLEPTSTVIETRAFDYIQLGNVFGMDAELPYASVSVLYDIITYLVGNNNYTLLEHVLTQLQPIQEKIARWLIVHAASREKQQLVKQLIPYVSLNIAIDALVAAFDCGHVSMVYQLWSDAIKKNVSVTDRTEMMIRLKRIYEFSQPVAHRDYNEMENSFLE